MNISMGRNIPKPKDNNLSEQIYEKIKSPYKPNSIFNNLKDVLIKIADLNPKDEGYLIDLKYQEGVFKNQLTMTYPFLVMRDIQTFDFEALKVLNDDFQWLVYLDKQINDLLT